VRAGLLLLLIAICAGCTRARYRVAADNDTYSILNERVVSPTFAVGRIALEPVSTSRLHDPFDPDRPPKPPDDPAAALFMAAPGGLRGAHHWDQDGLTDIIEPPGWEIILEPRADGTIVLNQDKAVAIALENSREFQTQLENLYLVALSLTLNRFEFNLQWFLTNATTFRHFGSGGSPTETNTLDVETHLGFSRNLAAGGQLLVDFANSFVYEITGGQRQFRSNFLVSLIQPLLRGAGRKIRLEGLTQAERDTLYAVRDFARFRKAFWADVAIRNGGYLDLLLALQTIRNNEANLKRQEETYRLYNELFVGGRASAVELDQFFQSLQGARLELIESQTEFNNLLDQFKFTLGLPPRLSVELDDSLLAEFILVDPVIERRRDLLEAFQRERLAELDEPPSVESLRTHFRTLLEYAQRGPEDLTRAAADLERWGQRLNRPLVPQEDAESRRQAQRTYDVLQPQVAGIGLELKAVAAAIETHQGAISEETRKAAWETLTADIRAVLAAYDGIVALQTQARIHLIELPAAELAGDEALAVAKQDRLDLMNQLGAVTDAWRKVTVAANALKADLDVVASANLGTDPDHLNPFNFASEASAYSLGVQFDGPLNRLAERNAYRASLIAFQRARRDYMALSDTVELQVRRDLRQLDLVRVGFEISRQQLLAAARQFENARITLLGPRDRRSANDTTTLNLLQALTSLLQARNALAQNYINYEQQRVQLLLDIEALQLDARGFPLYDTLRLDQRVAPETIDRPEPQPGGLPGPAELVPVVPTLQPAELLPAP
jgi:outer membrane protein TolC